MNTNKRRELADSKYNERRAECEKAVEELQKVTLEYQTLGELRWMGFDRYSYLIQRRKSFETLAQQMLVLESTVI